MNIAYLIDDISAPGGAQKMAVKLAIETASDPNRSITLVSLERATNPELDEKLRVAGVDVHYFPGSGLSDLGRFRRLIAFLRSGDFDLVHTNLVYANILGTTAARLAGLPSVGGLRNVYLANDTKDGLRHRIEGWILRLWAGGAMAVGPSTAAAHRNRLGRLPIEPVANPLPLPGVPHPGTRARIRAELGVAGSTVVAIAVGTLRHTKGYPDLVEAFARVSRENSDTLLLIVGEGAQRAAVEGAIVDAGSTDHIRLLGHRDDVADLLAASDIYVNSSHAEGLSNAILEAMGSRLPVVVTDVGDSAWVVGEAGIVVPPRDPTALAEAIAQLADSPADRSARGELGRTRVFDNHSVDGWVQAMFDFYRRSADRTGRAVRTGHVT